MVAKLKNMNPDEIQAELEISEFCVKKSNCIKLDEDVDRCNACVKKKPHSSAAANYRTAKKGKIDAAFKAFCEAETSCADKTTRSNSKCKGCVSKYPQSPASKNFLNKERAFCYTTSNCLDETNETQCKRCFRIYPDSPSGKNYKKRLANKENSDSKKKNN